MARLRFTRTAGRLPAKVAGPALAAVGLILIVLAAAGVLSAGAATTGNVKLVTQTSTPATPNSETEPFGAPTAPDYTVPPGWCWC